MQLVQVSVIQCNLINRILRGQSIDGGLKDGPEDQDKRANPSMKDVLEADSLYIIFF
jgi:hypothetical protein